MSFDSIPVSLIEDITKNYDIIKTSFSSLSKLFSKLSKIEQAPIEVPSKEATPSNTELLSHKRVKRLHIPRGMKEYSKILKGIGFGRIISVHCYEEEEKVTGYKIHLRYYKSNYTIGPFKDYDFTCKLNKTIQEELKMLGCTKANYRDKVNAKVKDNNYSISFAAIKKNNKECYIIIDISNNKVYKNIVDIYKRLDKLLNKYSDNVEISFCIVGEYTENLQIYKCNDILENILYNMNAKSIDTIRDKDFVSVTAYSNLLTENNLEYFESKINLNIGIRYSKNEDKTLIYIATPIIKLDY